MKISRLLLSALVGSLVVIGALSLPGERSAGASSACQDWEVQWWTPMTTPVSTPGMYVGVHADPSPQAAPPGWEPLTGSFGQGTNGYALRRCVR